MDANQKYIVTVDNMRVSPTAMSLPEAEAEKVARTQKLKESAGADTHTVEVKPLLLG